MTAEKPQEQGALLDDLLSPIPRTAIVPAVRAALGLSQRQTDRIVVANLTKSTAATSGSATR